MKEPNANGKSQKSLIEHKLPKSLWSQAIQTSTYLTNRSPTKANSGATPEELFFAKKPDLNHLKTFGV